MSWSKSIVSSNRSMYSFVLVNLQWSDEDLCEIFLFWFSLYFNQLTWTKTISLTYWTHRQYSLANFNLSF